MSLQNRPTIADSQSRPTIADSQNRPITADSQNRPITADSQNRPTTADSQNRPTTADSQSRPTNPVVRKTGLFFAGAAALAVLIFIAFAPALTGGFVWDDDFWVYKNPHVTGGKSIWEVWYAPSFPGQNYPLTYTFFRAQFLLWGYNPFGYHLGNLLLHSLDAVLLWLVLRRLRVGGAWFAAAVFAVHPLMTESVAWVTEAKNTLGAFFLLSSLLAFLAWEETGRKIPALISLFLYGLALAAKTYFCTFPVVLLILVWLRKGKIGKRSASALLPFVLLALAAGSFTWLFEVWHVGVRGEDWTLPAAGRFLIAGRAFWFYLGKLSFPVDLAFIYPRWEIDPGSAVQWAFPLLAALFFSVLWCLRSSLGRGPLAAFACYAVLLSPSLGFISFYAQVYSFVADHYAYLAVIGPIALGADALSRLGAPILRRLGAAVCLSVLVLLSFRQAGAYRDLETLWRDTLRKNPAAEMAQNNLGVLLLDRGEIEEAIVRCRESVRLNPRNAFAWNNLGLALSGRGEHASAIRAYDRAIELRPRKAEFHAGLAFALEKAGRREEAEAAYDRALQIKPDLVEALLRRGALREEMGKTAEAEEDCRAALASDPACAEAYNQLGLLVSRRGETAKAEEYYQTAVRLNPSFREARANLVNALAEEGKIEEAVSFYREFAAADPGNPRVHYNLAVALVKTARPEEAIAEYRQALRLDPDYASARANLAGILYDRGETEEAVKELNRLLSRDPAQTGARARYNLAIIQFERGEIEEAKKNLEKALARDPGLVPARDLLKRISDER